MSSLPTEKREDVDVLVSTHWVANRWEDPSVRIVQCNQDTSMQAGGLIPGAVDLDCRRDLSDPLSRDLLDVRDFQRLVGRLGITPDTLVVFSGDRGNLWACYAYWVFQLFGHTRAAIMDGGRTKWVQEHRPLFTDGLETETSAYRVARRDDRTNRAFREDVLLHVVDKSLLLDVRSPEEFNGDRTILEDNPEECAVRGGHVPGALSVPWTLFLRESDKTFRPREEIERVLDAHLCLDSNNEVITYCRVGERSSLAWFVLKKLMGWSNVRNYDGGWVEWGNAVGLPIER